MGKLKLILGTHNSQSPEEITPVIEEYYQGAYKTFLTTLYNFPSITTSLYYSGSLLEWIENSHPEFFSVLLEMINSKQVELLGGGYYDPALTLLSFTDRLGQMEKLTTYIRKNFSKKPRGCFLPESVWDSSLVPSLKSCGFDYVYLDENQFLSAGIPDDELFNPVITEDQGKIVTVLPISSTLSKMFLRDKPSKVIDFLKENSHKTGVFTIIFKGEYLNSPIIKSKDIKKWLEEFCTLLEANSSWIETISPSKYVKQIQGNLKRAYFPQYSINGMRNKPLPLVSQRELNRLTRHLGALGDVSHWINSGFFKQFIARYQDSSHIYSKMLYINLLVNQIKGDRSRKKTAREELWRAQSHYVYWHGNHLGIYDKDLRERSYRFLIEAELTTRVKGIFKSGINHFDIDLDGKKEALYQGDNYNAYISSKGGVIFELDHLKKNRNLVSTVMRREEAYHIEKYRKLGYDTYTRKMFHDHFISSDCSISDYQFQSFTENGTFINASYDYKGLNRESKSVTLHARGGVRSYGVEHSVNIEKKYNFNKGELKITYIIENLEDSTLETVFAPEFNLSLGYGEKDSVVSFDEEPEVSLTKSNLTAKSVEHMRIEDRDNSIKTNLTFSEKATKVWTVTQFSKTMHNGSIEDLYQFTSFLPQWNIKIAPKSNFSLTINFSLN